MKAKKKKPINARYACENMTLLVVLEKHTDDVHSVLCHSSSLSSPSQTHAALWLFM